MGISEHALRRRADVDELSLGADLSDHVPGRVDERAQTALAGHEGAKRVAGKRRAAGGLGCHRNRLDVSILTDAPKQGQEEWGRCCVSCVSNATNATTSLRRSSWRRRQSSAPPRAR